MKAFVFVCLVAVAYGQAGGSGWTGFRIAQESSKGAGDFDDNILGFITPVDASTQTIPDYYGYGSASFLGTGITPLENTTQMFLVYNKFSTGSALFYYTVFDKSKSCCGGKMFSQYTVSGPHADLDTQFVDDSGSTKTKFEGWGGGVYWRWTGKGTAEASMQGLNTYVSCCSDGHVFGPLTGSTQIIADIHRPDSHVTPGEWWFLSFESTTSGDPVHLVYEPNRRVRLDNHACDPAVDCHGHGTCNTHGKCDCEAGYAGDFCDSCATDFMGYPTCTSSVCLGTTIASMTITDGHYASCGDTKHTGTCKVICDDGFVTTADAICEKGTWVAGACHRHKDDDCIGAPPDVAHGEWAPCADVWAGENCTLFCDKGYHKTGDALCSDTKYTDVGTCEPDRCTSPPPTTPNGTFAACTDVSRSEDNV